jgi:hypothetical protein
MWDKLMNKVPTTSLDVEYGTPQMAQEMFRLFRETDVKTSKILVMAGHEEGIISIGKDLKEALEILVNYS